MKAITTRSGVAYEGPSIPTNPSPKKVVERETEETTDKEQSNFQGSTAHIPPPVNPIPILKTRCSGRLLPKPNYSYPYDVYDQNPVTSSRINGERSSKSFKIALSTLVSGNCSAMLLKKLPEKLGDPACEEFSQEVLSFLNNSLSGNPNPTSDPILSSTTPSFTPFEGGDFILEEIEAFLQTPDKFTDLDDDFYDTEGDILYLEQLLNEDPSPTLPPKKNEDLKEVTKAKPSIEEPPELELKDLSSHLEYAYLKENDKLPVIIAKGLKGDEKDALLTVLKSHKRAIAWKITDIKGIDPRFCTHKILMEDDYKPMVQS
ncbi:hypothetical protein Tco_0548480 [Tanacetum coccineum]